MMFRQTHRTNSNTLTTGTGGKQIVAACQLWVKGLSWTHTYIFTESTTLSQEYTLQIKHILHITYEHEK